MATNRFENSRISEGTLHIGAQGDDVRNAPNESKAISRDDIRDGFADRPPADLAISNMIAEGGPASPDANVAANLRMRGLVAASTLVGHRVLKPTGDELGNIEEVMLDLEAGRIAYAVLSFRGFPGISDKRFPVPWNALQIDAADHEFILDIDRRTLEGAPDFDKDNWPDMADLAFGRIIHNHYGTSPYWEHTAHAGNWTRQ
jgi:sporulation protein YlmC with PRC-barrel domain